MTRIDELNAALAKLTEQVTSLDATIREINRERPVVISLEDRRYQPGDMVVSVNNEQRVALHRRITRDMEVEDQSSAWNGKVTRWAVYATIMGVWFDVAYNVYKAVHG